MGMDPLLLARARDYALTADGAGYIVRHGRVVLSWGDARQRFDLKSTTKSFGSIALGLALSDGLVRLEDKAQKHFPGLGMPPEENAAQGWLEQITLLHLASQTAGFEKPGGFTRLLFPPGTKWDYSDSGPNWLADCLTLVWRRDLDEVMFERVFTPLGITRSDLTWRRNAYRPPTLEGIPRREFGSGIHANVDALARIGYLMLREGHWKDQRILAGEYVRQAVRVPPGQGELEVLRPDDYGAASRHYGLLWWNNADRTLPEVPRDAFWSWGLYDSLIIVIPSLDIVVARAGKSWARTPGAIHYDVLRPFLVPIVNSVTTSGTNSLTSSAIGSVPNPANTRAGHAPHPPSPVIMGIRWAPADSILRYAMGSDNWPITWGDDGWFYTAYGDGRGFEPFVDQKLSLGLARFRGRPESLKAENLRAASLEQLGDGARGRKASGLLMADGVLYLWARNATNSQLASSVDHGRTWTWADWRFTESFGCPTFLNFGPNYHGARDDFVYVYSPDTSTAYQRSDRMVLARAPKQRILERAAWEFFRSLDPPGGPVWTADIRERGAVFSHPGSCYRSSVTFNQPLRRYLWVQTGPGKDTRFAGGFAIYDAPEPWGPWTTVEAVENWDVGPGETASFPAPWISADGRELHLVFSGDDHLSIRAATLVLHEDRDGALKFERRVLSERYLCDGITAGDLNRDGHPDIVAGPYWYEGPDFIRQNEFYPARDFDPAVSPTDSLYSHIHDFNGDGWPDILVLGRVHLHQAFWYENPRGAPGLWPKHFAFHRVQGESPPFTDVDGDGRPELVAHWENRWGFIRPDRNSPASPWRFSPISSRGEWHHFYHGEGIGDVNGDSRPDLILNEGWYEQPTGSGEWTRHDFRFGERGGAQMFACDVDGDQLPDILTALDAHGWGLAWFEQMGGSGKPTFRKHLIMGDRSQEPLFGVAFSQPHAVALADLNGDQLPDIITGKRRWAHGPTGDVEPMAEPVVYWFELVREGNSARFVPHKIDDNSGVGLQITVADVNLDRLPDILTASKLGAFLFINKGRPLEN
jgi:CubicO group peptidase (beta-lactamase class C family)